MAAAALSPRPAAPAAGAEVLADLGVWPRNLQKAQAYEQILMDIILGHLPAGARLEERSLARRYGAGLAGVRAALNRLALEELVVRKARSATLVTTLDLEEVRQTFEARRLLEPHCVALAAGRNCSAEVAALRRAFDGAHEALEVGDRKSVVLMDLRFHAILARSSGNCVLARLLIALQHKAARFWAHVLASTAPDTSLAEIAEHLAIVDAIERRDAEGAREAVLRVLARISGQMDRAIAAGCAPPV
ncbi:MAG TPA: GntR family transcriptional regulator [Caulobacteraceae bacterium]|nr:GntR family transcriptional regulator [Caulobacteraceae bacterium]